MGTTPDPGGPTIREMTEGYWGLAAEDLLQRLGTTHQGLTSEEAQRRLGLLGPNLLKPRKHSGSLLLFLSQFRSPITLILLFAAGLSFFLRDPTDAVIILAIVLASSLLGFWQERGAACALEKLLAIVRVKATVVRDGKEVEIPLEEIVPGDITVLSAGTSIPGDGRILESKELYVSEATLTGETFPTAKTAGTVAADAPLSERTNTVFMGTHVVSGTAKALVVRSGRTTEFGRISERLKLRPPETEFERGLRRFGTFLMEVTLVLVLAIFAINVLLSKPILEAFLFSLAIAVGLTPQLLPAIISVSLSRGAARMAQEKVIVRRLNSIENFGSMNVLCSDKTGTVTEGVVRLQSAMNPGGEEDEGVLFYAYMNAFYETGYANPVDEAIRGYRSFDLSAFQKLDELPYDFIRKRLSILVQDGGKHLIVTKGALENVLTICSFVRSRSGETVPIVQERAKIQNQYEKFSGQGFRTLGIACKEVGSDITGMGKDQETDMTFVGYLLLSDPTKAGIRETVGKLKDLGIAFKVITGDNRLVAARVGKQVGLSDRDVLTGPDLQGMSDEALLSRVNEVDVFAEVEPNQKERILLAIRKSGNVVGYMGDGINDATALHAADVGISVDSAVDVAKEAADIVLLDKDLDVLIEGVTEGRRTFANTLKYVFMATSANFGNMFSMAGASVFLPFLPLLPKQILLTNLLTDFPEMAISSDSVDPEMMAQPRRWNVSFIRRFMLIFGILSSLFDYATFAVLLLVLHATTTQFRTGWFLESVVSAVLIVMVIRTRKPVFRSAPCKVLLFATAAVALSTVFLPYTPVGRILGFGPLPFEFLLILGLIVLAYLLAAEVVKRAFYRRVRF